MQTDGNLNIIGSVFMNNFAMRASLFFLFNSQSSLRLEGGSIKNNGFYYHPHINIQMMLLLPNKETPKLIQSTFSKN